MQVDGVALQVQNPGQIGPQRRSAKLVQGGVTALQFCPETSCTEHSIGRRKQTSSLVLEYIIYKQECQRLKCTSEYFPPSASHVMNWPHNHCSHLYRVKCHSQGRDYRNLDLDLVESIPSLLFIILFEWWKYIIWLFKLDLNEKHGDLDLRSNCYKPKSHAWSETLGSAITNSVTRNGIFRGFASITSYIEVMSTCLDDLVTVVTVVVSSVT